MQPPNETTVSTIPSSDDRRNTEKSMILFQHVSRESRNVPKLYIYNKLTLFLTTSLKSLNDVR